MRTLLSIAQNQALVKQKKTEELSSVFPGV